MGSTIDAAAMIISIARNILAFLLFLRASSMEGREGSSLDSSSLSQGRLVSRGAISSVAINSFSVMLIF